MSYESAELEQKIKKQRQKVACLIIAGNKSASSRESNKLNGMLLKRRQINFYLPTEFYILERKENA